MQTALESKPSDCRGWSGASVRLIAVSVKPVALKAKRKAWWSRLGENGLLPVTDKDRRLKGILRQDRLLMGDALPSLTLERAEQLIEGPVSLFSDQAVEDAFRLFEVYNLPLIPIVDSKNRYTGECACYTRYYLLQSGLLKPSRVGGFATPFGVYLTSGIHSGGLGWKELALTGLLFGVVVSLLDWASLLAFSVLGSLWPQVNLWPSWAYELFQVEFTLLSFLALIRFSSVAGFHAAEHMTVSAIERDLPLSLESVRTQPRTHIRCGTNLIALLAGCQALAFSLKALAPSVHWFGLVLYTGLWLLLIWKFWRPIGFWVQRHFTTKPPSDFQLLKGIQAGEELLNKFRLNPHPTPGFWQKLWGSHLLILLVVTLGLNWLLTCAINFVLQQ